MIAPPFRRNKKYKQKNNTQIIADKKKKKRCFWFIKKEDNHNVYKRIEKFINQHQDKYIFIYKRELNDHETSKNKFSF
jgi:hypothetical protein